MEETLHHLLPYAVARKYLDLQKSYQFYRFFGVQDMYFGDLKRCKLSPIHRRQTPGDCSGLPEPVETGLTVGFRVKL